MSVLRVSFKGLFFDRLVANAQGSQLTPGGVGLYRARNRSYSPTLGRWLQRDPNATAQPILEAVLSNGLAFSDFALSMDVPTLYGDGMNLYQFGRSNPIANGDAMGLFNYGDHMTSIAIGQSLLGAAIGGAMGGWRGATAGVLAGFAGGVAGAAFAGSATGLLATFMFGYADGFVGGYIQSALTNRPDLQTNFNDAAESALIGMAFAGMGHLLGVYADDILRAACFETGTSVSMIDGTALPIEAIPVGAVVASAPDRPEGLDCDRTIDPTDWRMVSLAIDEAECTANTIELLRPLRWVQNSQLH